jgi:hypothetical protein
MQRSRRRKSKTPAGSLRYDDMATEGRDLTSLHDGYTNAALGYHV